MRCKFSSLALLGLAITVKADLHQLIVGTFGTDYLYTLEFDDSALTLELIGNKSVTTSSSWIALSHDKKNLYGTAVAFNTSWLAETEPRFASYRLGNATDIELDTILPLGGNCTSTKAIFIVASTESPYAVYGTPFGGSASCGSVFSVDSNGALSSIIQNYTYSSTSGVHGLAFSNTSTYLYSADDSANTLWTHSISPSTGELTLLSSFPGPTTGSDPRHVATHPAGQYLYVILEGANELAQYSIDTATGIPFYQDVSFPLIPSGFNNSLYMSDEVALSANKSLLWATSRSRPSSTPGYISAFSLDDSGAIIEQLFLTNTSSSGGEANSVAPAPFNEKYAALTDSSMGFVEIWELGEGDGLAAVVARVDLVDGGCCANAVWYS